MQVDATKMYFSPADAAFYAGSHWARHGQRWPVDAVPVTEEQFRKFSGAPPLGKTRGAVDGQPAWIDPPKLDDVQASKLFNFLIDNFLNSVASDWGYSKGIDNATTWSTSSDPQFAAEGAALAQYRDKVWSWASAQEAGKSNLEGIPSAPVRPKVKTKKEGK